MSKKNIQKIKTTPPIISVKNVSKTFLIPHEKISTLRSTFTTMFKEKSHDVLDALREVSFEIKKGEFFGIVGRNGSGKSTLLKILAGVYTADKGNIQINGAISPFLELGIGFNPELSGRDNIYLNATVLGMKKKEIDKKFEDIVAFSELERFIDQKLKNYSSGMQMRLAFSVAIHTNRDILLMDEVLAVGDSNFHSKCINEFMRHRTLGRTVILVTHDISVVQKYCDRAMLLRDGHVSKIGIPEDVCNEYIYQNMNDEQKRLSQEQQTTLYSEDISFEKKEDKKNVEILCADFLDANGEIRDVFQTEESFSIRVKFKINKKVPVVNIGIGIHSVSGGQVFGYNTQMDNFIIDLKLQQVVLYFESFPVLKGDYYLNVVCFGDFEQEYYDIKPHYKNLKIYTSGQKYRYRGFLDVDHSWS